MDLWGSEKEEEAHALFLAKKYDEALTKYEELKAGWPVLASSEVSKSNLARVCARIGSCYLARDPYFLGDDSSDVNYVAARDYFDLAIQYDSHNQAVCDIIAKSFLSKGKKYFSQADEEMIYEFYETALEYAPENKKLQRKLALVEDMVSDEAVLQTFRDTMHKELEEACLQENFVEKERLLRLIREMIKDHSDPEFRGISKRHAQVSNLVLHLYQPLLDEFDKG